MVGVEVLRDDCDLLHYYLITPNWKKTTVAINNYNNYRCSYIPHITNYSHFQVNELHLFKKVQKLFALAA
jgi:hypothetical protein